MPFDKNGNWIDSGYTWSWEQDAKNKQAAMAMTPNEVARRRDAPGVENALSQIPTTPTSTAPTGAPPLGQEWQGLNPFSLNNQDYLYNHTLAPIQDFFNRVAGSATNEMTLGATQKPLQQNPFLAPDIQQSLAPAQTATQKTADVLGSVLGFAVPGEAAYKTGGKLAELGLSKLAPQVPGWLSSLVRGTGAGLAYGTANEGIDAGLDTRNDGRQSIGQRLGNIGMDAALFGGGDAALYGIGKGIQSTPLYKNWALSQAIKDAPLASDPLTNIVNRPAEMSPYSQTMDKTVFEPQLALPAPKQRISQTLEDLSGVNQNYRAPKPISPIDEQAAKQMNEWAGITGETPVMQTVDEPYLTPNQGNLSQGKFKVVNPASRQLDQLFQLAKQTGLPPGREYEYLQGLWPQIAPKNAGTLDELIQQATKEVSTNDLLNAGKQKLQDTKNATKYGVYPNYKVGNPAVRQVEKQIKSDPSFILRGGPLVPVNPTSSITETTTKNVLQLLKSFKKKQVEENPFVNRKVMVGGKEVLPPKKILQESVKAKNTLPPDVLNLANDIFGLPKETVTNAEKPQIGILNNLAKKNEVNPVKNDVVSSLAGSDNWKDKAKPLLKRETMVRNFEDVMGKKAPKMIQRYLDPIAKSEADRIRFLNQERNTVKDMGIKNKSEFDKLVQRYGEGPDNGGITLEELKKMAPNNWKQIKETAEKFRAKYDELLTKANEVLEKNGFNPIPKRKDYFPHYQEIDSILNKFGVKMSNYTLPTDINGLTQNFKPSKNFFAHFLKRKGDQTSYGVLEGFDRYIEGISNIIHHTGNIKQLRSLEKEIRTKYEGDTHLSNFVAELQDYTNILAGKKALFDRAAEDVIGRHVFNVLDNLKRRTGANMIGMNVSSALTGYIPLTQALATTGKRDFTIGAIQTIRNIFHDDGFTAKSDFLTRREGSDPLMQNLWDKTIDKSMWMMKAVDHFTAQTIVRSKYSEGIRKGMSESEAMHYADDWAARIMSDRSKGAQPTLFSSKTLGFLTQFQLEVNNQMSFIFKDIPRNSKNWLGMSAAIAQVFVYSYLFNDLYQMATGRRPALDPIGITKQAIEDYNNQNLQPGKATKNLLGNISDNLPFTSLLTGGRIPLLSGVPDVKGMMTGDANVKDEMLKPLIFLTAPTGGSQLKKMYQGATTMGLNPLSPQKTTGVYTTDKNGNDVLKYPVQSSNGNMIKSMVFGPSSLQETQDYYDMNRHPLSSFQTKQTERSIDPLKTYGKLMMQRRKDTIFQDMQSVRKDKSLNSDERSAQLAKLRKMLSDLKGSE